eukprot:tig00021234_g19415.t1
MADCGREDGAIAELPAEPPSRRCKKCDAPAVIYVKNESLCGDCLKRAVTSGFKSVLSRDAGFSRGDVALFAFSGGLASRAGLHLLDASLGRGVARAKRPWSAVVAHIDEGPFSGLSDDERAETVRAAREAAEGYGFEFLSASLKLAFGPAGDPAGAEKVRGAWEGAASATAREDLASALRLRALLQLARDRSCARVIVCSTATRLAAGSLAAVCKGRGASAPWDAAALDGRLGGGPALVRPMRELLSKEVALYARMEGLEPAPGALRSPLTASNPKRSSIARLCDGFVATLQAGFPFTAHTVNRTVEKAGATGGDEGAREAPGLCPLCYSVLGAADAAEAGDGCEAPGPCPLSAGGLTAEGAAQAGAVRRVREDGGEFGGGRPALAPSLPPPRRAASTPCAPASPTACSTPSPRGPRLGAPPAPRALPPRRPVWEERGAPPAPALDHAAAPPGSPSWPALPT